MNDGHRNIVPLRALPSDSELEHGLVRGLEDGNDEQLMALTAGGDKAAFAVLVTRYLPRVTKFCLRFVGEMAAAQELTQEIFLEVWVGRGRYESQGKFTVFLFVIARTRCLNRVRDEGRRGRREQALRDEGQAVPSQLDLLLDKERQRQVQKALLGLSVKLREAVLLRFDQGLDYRDVALILDCNESTTRSRVRLAMMALRDAIAGENP
jgi:RNA polymerase sigma-70 factor, ECF subfamily